MALNYGDIKRQISSAVRLGTADTDQSVLIGRAVNDTLQDVHGRYDWHWTLDRQIVQTEADKTSGTVSVASEDVTVTGSSTAFASGDVGKYIQFQGSNDWYKITAVASSTELTIEAGYTGTSALSAGTYTIRKFFYSASVNAEKIMDVRQVQSPRKLTPVPYRNFDGIRPHPTDTGKGEAYFVYGVNSSNQLQFFVYPYADARYNLEVRYKKHATELSIDSDEPAIPPKWRHILVDGGIYRALRYVNPNESTLESIRVQKGIYEDGIARMLAEAEPTSDYHPVLQSCDRRSDPLSRIQLPEQFDVNP